MNMGDEADEGAAIDGSSFVKIFLDKDPFHKTMRVPSVFWKKKMMNCGGGEDIVYLKCRADTWQVNLVKDEESSSSSSISGGGGGLRFSGPGWSKFVNDNSICSGDIAIFKFYDDNVTGFKVTIFYPSGCEKHLPRYNLQQEMNIKSESDDDDPASC